LVAERGEALRVGVAGCLHSLSVFGKLKWSGK
jgi:hypothetical protein